MFVLRMMIVAILMMSFVACKSTESSYGTTSSQYNSEIVKLEKSGMQVVMQGSRMRIIIPVINFFTPQKNKVREFKQAALIELAVFVAKYGHGQAPVRVIGYTNNIGAGVNQYARSLNTAEVVAAFLWRGGVSLDRTTIQAMGAGDPIASNATPAGRSANDRVEVWVN